MIMVRLISKQLFALYIVMSLGFLKRFTIRQHERHFELAKQQFCWPSFGWILGSIIQKLWSKLVFKSLPEYREFM